MAQAVLSRHGTLPFILLPVAHRWFSDSKETRELVSQERRISDDRELVHQD